MARRAMAEQIDRLIMAKLNAAPLPLIIDEAEVQALSEPQATRPSSRPGQARHIRHAARDAHRQSAEYR